MNLKPALLIRLLKQRLAHNEAYLLQGHNTRLESLRLTYLNRPVHPDTVYGHQWAIEEENEFLRALIKSEP